MIVFLNLSGQRRAGRDRSGQALAGENGCKSTALPATARTQLPMVCLLSPLCP